MSLFAGAYLAVLAGMPICLGIAWWLWAGHHRATPKTWRSTALFLGMLCASANACAYFIWQPLAHQFLMSHTPQWRIFDLSGDVGIGLILGALIGALAGIGKPRLPLTICAVLGFLLWLPIGVL